MQIGRQLARGREWHRHCIVAKRGGRGSRRESFRSNMSDRTAKRVQIASAAFILALVAFAYGIAVAHYQIWPFGLIQDSSYAVGSIVRAGEIVPRGRRIEPPQGASRQPFTVHDPSRIGDGLFVFLGSDDSRHAYSAWLYDTAGRKLHTWRIDYHALDPNGPSSGTDM